MRAQGGGDKWFEDVGRQPETEISGLPEAEIPRIEASIDACQGRKQSTRQLPQETSKSARGTAASAVISTNRQMDRETFDLLKELEFEATDSYNGKGSSR
jgi:hypothetical protein